MIVEWLIKAVSREYVVQQGASVDYIREGQVVCHGGLGKQDGQPSSEDVGDELIGYLVLKKEVHYSNQRERIKERTAWFEVDWSMNNE